MVKKISNDDRKLRAFLATFLSIVGFIIALIAWKDDEYVMFYAKQSLIVFVVGAIAGALQIIFMFIPIIGWIIKAALNIVVLIAWILSWVYALSMEKKDVPIIGDYARKIKI